MQSFEELAGIVEAIRPDIEKADRGNKAAGTRIRGAMQKIKKAAQEVRKEVLGLRESSAAETPGI